MTIKYWKYFLFEGRDYKINWIQQEPVDSQVDDELKELNELASKELYNTIYLSDKEIPNLDSDTPLLNFINTGFDKIEKKVHFMDDIYNRPKEMEKSSRKDDWHNLLGDADWLPKTTTDKSKVKNLKFPIIAKPATGHSGIGIMKFDTLEEYQKELDKGDSKLDVFSEVIKDIDTEFRMVFCRDTLFLVYERVPIKKDNKTIDTKNPDESLSFLYVEQDLDKEGYDLGNIVEEFKDKIDLDFFALDVMRDKSGKYWVIESNSAIGMGANTMARAYEAICNDFYRQVPEQKQDIVDQICTDYFNIINKRYPKEVKTSKNPKIYKQ